jgi:iron complex transport system substrate-binding protein
MSLSRRRLLASAAGLSAVIAGLSACNASAGPEHAAPSGSAAAGGVEPGAYPVTIKHRFGETTLTEEPKLVVTAGLKEQDDCLAVGVVPVAATTWFDLDGDPLIGPWAKEALGSAQTSADQTPTKLTYVDRLEFEKIAAAAPDLIVVIYSAIKQADYDKLSKIAPTIAQSADHDDWGVPWDVQATMVGRALGRPALMAEKVAAAKKSIADTVAAHPEFAGKSGVVATPWEGVFVYGVQDPRPHLLTELGMTLPPDLDKATGSAWGGNLSAERVDLLDVDAMIWFVEGENKSEVLKNKAYASLAVHKEGRDIFTTPGDGVYEAFSFLTVLSMGYLLANLSPRLSTALDGDPGTSTDPA